MIYTSHDWIIKPLITILYCTLYRNNLYRNTWRSLIHVHVIRKLLMRGEGEKTWNIIDRCVGEESVMRCCKTWSAHNAQKIISTSQTERTNDERLRWMNVIHQVRAIWTVEEKNVRYEWMKCEKMVKYICDWIRSQLMMLTCRNKARVNPDCMGWWERPLMKKGMVTWWKGWRLKGLSKWGKRNGTIYMSPRCFLSRRHNWH